MDKKTYYEKMFFIGGCWNCGASLPLLVISLFTSALFPLFGLEIPNNMIFFQISMVLIASMGVGYFIVGKDLTKNHAMVLSGIIGKACYFLITLFYLLMSEINLLMFMTGVIDLVFVVLFIEFLLKSPNSNK